MRSHNAPLCLHRQRYASHSKYSLRGWALSIHSCQLSPLACRNKSQRWCYPKNPHPPRCLTPPSPGVFAGNETVWTRRRHRNMVEQKQAVKLRPIKLQRTSHVASSKDYNCSRPDCCPDDIRWGGLYRLWHHSPYPAHSGGIRGVGLRHTSRRVHEVPRKSMAFILGRPLICSAERF